MDCELEQNEKKARSGERLTVRCSLAIANGIQVGKGWVFDVSMRGCLVESPIRVKVGDRLQLRLCLPEATALSDWPPAAANTIRPRSTTCCGVPCAVSHW